jgi:hypothetical protein
MIPSMEVLVTPSRDRQNSEMELRSMVHVFWCIDGQDLFMISQVFIVSASGFRDFANSLHLALLKIMQILLDPMMVDPHSDLTPEIYPPYLHALLVYIEI